MKRGPDPVLLIEALAWLEREALVTPRVAAKARRGILARCNVRRERKAKTGTPKKRDRKPAEPMAPSSPRFPDATTAQA